MGASDEKCIASWPNLVARADRDRDSARHSGDMPVRQQCRGGPQGTDSAVLPQGPGLLEIREALARVPVLGAVYCEVAGAVARVLGGAGCAIRTDGRPQGYLLLHAQYSAVLRQTLPRRYRDLSGRLKRKVGLKWKGQSRQLANEQRAIRANGWGGVWERPNCQAQLRLAPLVGQWCLAELIVHVRCVSDSGGAR